METTGYIVAAISIIVISIFVYKWFKPSKKASGGNPSGSANEKNNNNEIKG